MKKTLFASTALVAAGLVAAGTAQASDKIDLSLGGYSQWWVVGAWNSASFTRGQTSQQLGGAAVLPGATVPGASYNNVDVKGNNQVWFGGKTTLDNGMKVGVDVHLWAGGNTFVTTDTIDKAYVYVEGGFGKFLVGTQKNGTYLLHVQAPDAAGNWGEGGMMTGNQAIAPANHVNGMAGGNTTAINTTNNAEAITYVAPTFYGLTLGGSYLPHGQQNSVTPSGPLNLDNGAIVNDGGANVLTGGIQEVYGVGGLYARTIGGVGIKVSAGAVTAKLGNNTLGATQWFEQAYGTQLSYAGFTLGGSYRHQMANYDVGGIGTGGLGAAGNVSAWPGGSFANGSAYDAGLQYATGPYAVSFAYFRSSVMDMGSGIAINGNGAVNNGHDVIDMYQLSGKYNLGAGVDMLASAGYAKYNSAQVMTNSSADANHNSGWTVMSGLSLTF